MSTDSESTKKAGEMAQRSIRMPADNWEEIDRAAKARGFVNVSEWVRVTLLAEAREVMAEVKS